MRVLLTPQGKALPVTPSKVPLEALSLVSLQDAVFKTLEKSHNPAMDHLCKH